MSEELRKLREQQRAIRQKIKELERQEEKWHANNKLLDEFPFHDDLFLKRREKESPTITETKKALEGCVRTFAVKVANKKDPSQQLKLTKNVAGEKLVNLLNEEGGFKI